MKVSIFIPVYNGGSYLQETIDSLLHQTFSNFEVLCVDDSSSDESLNILKEYASKDSRIKVFQKPNGGDAPHSWQFVTPHLTGGFTLYMSQDDLMKPDTLECLVGRQQETDADAVIPALTWYYGEDVLLKTDRGVNGDLSPILTGKEAFELMMDYTIPGFALWRTDIIRENPVPLVAYNSDEYAQRLWCSKCHIVAFSEGEFLYRQNNPESITQQFSSRQLESSITDAMILDLAFELKIAQNTIICFANKKYKDLWFYTTWFLMHRGLYSRNRRHQLCHLFSKAYHSLHSHITLTHWKYRFSKRNITLFWVLVILKVFRAKMIDYFSNLHMYGQLGINVLLQVRLRLHKLFHGIHHPIVHYYAVCWNEEHMLPFMFQHYQSFVDHFTLYDNHSSDSSINIIRSRKDTTVIEFDSDGFCDTIHNDIKNSCWKKSRGHADYVIVCDIDEFLYHPDIKDKLSELKREHISVVKPTGYNMYSETPPDYQSGKPLTSQITQGIRDPMFDKCILFDPHAVVDINYKPGSHECHPRYRGRVLFALRLLHYKNLGLQWMLERNRLYVQRLSKDNIEKKYGIEYLRDEKTIADEFHHNLQLAQTIVESCPPSRS